MRDLTRGSLLMAASGLAFGSLTVLTKLAYAEGAAVSTLLVVRFGVAALALLPFAWLAPRAPRVAARAFLLGLVGYFATTFLFFESLRTLPAGVASFLLYLAPIPVVLLARVLFAEKLGAVGMVGVACGVAGLALLALGPDVALPAGGVALALGSAGAYAATVLAGRRVVQDGSPWIVAAGVCAGAAVAWLAVGFGTGLPPMPSAAAWFYGLTIALLCTAVAIAAFYLGIRIVGAARGSVISMLEPASSVLLAAVVLDERLSVLQLAGCALILAGVTLASR